MCVCMCVRVSGCYQVDMGRSMSNFIFTIKRRPRGRRHSSANHSKMAILRRFPQALRGSCFRLKMCNSVAIWLEKRKRCVDAGPVQHLGVGYCFPNGSGLSPPQHPPPPAPPPMYLCSIVSLFSAGVLLFRKFKSFHKARTFLIRNLGQGLRGKSLNSN